MTFTRFPFLLLTAVLLGACVSPQPQGTGSSSGKRYSTQNGTTNHIGEVPFPVAAPPRFDGDDRTQEERDFETIGRSVL